MATETQLLLPMPVLERWQPLLGLDNAAVNTTWEAWATNSTHYVSWTSTLLDVSFPQTVRSRALLALMLPERVALPFTAQRFTELDAMFTQFSVLDQPLLDFASEILMTLSDLLKDSGSRTDLHKLDQTKVALAEQFSELVQQVLLSGVIAWHPATTAEWGLNDSYRLFERVMNSQRICWGIKRVMNEQVQTQIIEELKGRLDCTKYESRMHWYAIRLPQFFMVEDMLTHQLDFVLNTCKEYKLSGIFYWDVIPVILRRIPNKIMLQRRLVRYMAKYNGSTYYPNHPERLQRVFWYLRQYADDQEIQTYFTARLRDGHIEKNCGFVFTDKERESDYLANLERLQALQQLKTV